MRKRLTTKQLFYIGCSALITLSSATAAGPNPMLSYLMNSGMAPNADPQSCKTFCVQNGCNIGIANKTYDCFRGCSQHSANKTIMDCANQQFQEYLKALHQKINNLKAKKQALNQQLNQLNGNIGALQNQLTALQNQLAAAQGENQQLRAELDRLRDHMRHLEYQRDALMRRNNDLENKLREAEAEISSRDAHIDALQQELEQNQQEMEKLQKELDDMGRVLSQIMKDYGDIVGKYVALGNFINTTADKVRESEQEMQRVTRDFAAALTLDRAAIDAWIQQNRGHLERVQADYRRRSQEYSDFIDKALQILQAQGQDVQQDLQQLMDSYGQ